MGACSGVNSINVYHTKVLPPQVSIIIQRESSLGSESFSTEVFLKPGKLSSPLSRGERAGWERR